MSPVQLKQRQEKRLTTNDDIQARVDELVGALAAEAGVTTDRIVAELAKIAFIGCGEIAAVEEAVDDRSAQIAAISRPAWRTVQIRLRRPLRPIPGHARSISHH